MAVFLERGCKKAFTASFFGAPSMMFNLTVKVRYGGTYQPTISEAQAIHREVEVEEVCNKILAR